MSRKILSLTLSISLLFQYSGFAQSINLADYLSQSHNSVALDRFRPLSLRYFSYEPAVDNFKILLDKGDQKDLSDVKINAEADRLLTYFKIGLSLPNEKFWVNLRPDAEDQIIDPELEKTDLGKVLLEADLQLKKDTSSLTSPQSKEGKAYWEKLYKKAGELFGTENITIPTITRPWIVPGEIIVRESQDSAYIYKAVLKVMLEEDYLSRGGFEPAPTYQQYAFSDPRLKELNKYSTELIKESILPELTKRINSSKDYANLRQVFFSLILARWFKDAFGSSGSVSAPEHQSPENSYIKLINSGDLTDLTSKETWSKTAYFNEYKKSFAEGEYNLSEKIHTPGGQVIRRYTSGGAKIMPEKGAIESFAGNSSPVTRKDMVPITGEGNLKVGSPLVEDKELAEKLKGRGLFDLIEKVREKISASDTQISPGDSKQRVFKIPYAASDIFISYYLITPGKDDTKHYKNNNVKYRTIEIFLKNSNNLIALIKVYDKNDEISVPAFDALTVPKRDSMAEQLINALKNAVESSSAVEVPIKDEQLQKIMALSRKTDSRIFYLVIDGLGGMPVNGKTELEKARHLNLDKLSKEASVGLMNITDIPGITPGSGPGHFAIFGYDPYRSIGRGVLDALGAGIELEQGDIIARGNFATLNNEGVVVDRRAGRIKTENAEEIIKKHLAGIEIEGVKFLFYSTKDHRVALVVRGGNLSAQITDSDPGKEGLAPCSFESKTQQNKGSGQAAVLMNKLTEQINKRLRDNAINPAANTILFRGFDSLQGFPGLESVYKLKPAAICTYPAYKGIAKILGMDVLPVSGQTLQNQVDALKSNLNKYDFFYLHVKQTDSAGEDGNFEAKVKKIEEVDALIPQILSMMNLDNGDTLVVTADHSTPARMKAHSWHPVPVLIYSKNSFPADKIERFTENQAARGNLGKVIGRHIMPLAMAEAGKLDKLDGPISFISSSSLTVEDRNNDIIRNLQKVYDRIASEYSLIWGDDVPEEVKRYRETFVEMIPKNAAVVDVGTGPGRDTAWFSDHGLQAVGIDFSKEMITQAQKRHPKLKFQQMDMRRLEFESNSVDGIWDNEAFHHLPPDAARQAFKEFYRVMKSNGMLFLRVKQGSGEEFQPDKKYPNETRYFKFYQKDEIEHLAVSQGFEIIRSSSEIDSKKPEQTWVYLFAKKVYSTGSPLLEKKKDEFEKLLAGILGVIIKEIKPSKEIDKDLTMLDLGLKNADETRQEIQPILKGMDSVSDLNGFREKVNAAIVKLLFYKDSGRIDKEIGKLKELYASLNANILADSFYRAGLTKSKLEVVTPKDIKPIEIENKGHGLPGLYYVSRYHLLGTITVEGADYLVKVSHFEEGRRSYRIMELVPKDKPDTLEPLIRFHVFDDGIAPEISYAGHKEPKKKDSDEPAWKEAKRKAFSGLFNANPQEADRLQKVLVDGVELVFAEVLTAEQELMLLPYGQELFRLGIMGKRLFGGNWKNRKDITNEEQARDKAKEFKRKFKELPAEINEKAQIVIFPEAKWAKVIAEELKGSNISVGLQSLFFNPDGDLQRQIDEAVSMGVTYVNIGHSMHRLKGKGLTDEQANKIMKAILKDKRLIPWYAIEESGEKDSQEEIRSAVEIGLKDIPSEVISYFPITLEPTVLISTKDGSGKVDPNLKVSGEDAYRRVTATQEALDRYFGKVEVNVGYGASVKSSNSQEIFAQENVKNALVGGASLEAEEFFNLVVNAMKGVDSIASSAVTTGPLGGIDLTQMNMLIQPQGGFASSSLDFSLPELNKAEIEAFDLDKELELIQRMASSGIDPIDERLKKYLAVCFARGKTGKEIDELKLCLEDVFIAQQLDARKTPDGYKEVIVIADTRRFVLKESRLAAGYGERINLN